MCIAIYKPEGKEIPEENLEHCFNSNRDGAGILFPDGKRIHIIKDVYRRFDDFYEIYKGYATHPLVIHFRIRTRGDVSQANAHPFAISSYIGFAHNGGINIDNGDRSMSDTAIFNEEILKELPSGWWKNQAILRMLEEYVGTYNKLVFMRGNGEVFYLNKNSGTEVDGVWYSHGGFKPYRAPYVYNRDNRGTHSNTPVTPAKENTSWDIPEFVCRGCFKKYNPNVIGIAATNLKDRFGLCMECNRLIRTNCHPERHQNISDREVGICTECRKPTDSLDKLEILGG